VKKYFQDLPVRNLLWIEGHLDCLRVPGRAGADHFIVGGGRLATRIPRNHSLHPRDLLEHCFDTPEAATGEYGRLFAVKILGIDRWIWKTSSHKNGSADKQGSARDW